MALKANIGDIVALKGNTARVMKFKRGIVRRIVKAGGNIRATIYYVSRLNSRLTTPFLAPNIRVIKRR